MAHTGCGSDVVLISAALSSLPLFLLPLPSATSAIKHDRDYFKQFIEKVVEKMGPPKIGNA